MAPSEPPAVAIYRPGFFEIGCTGVICKVDNDSYIVKYPKTFPGQDIYNDMYLEQMITERQIYERVGPHEGIISYHGHYNDEGAIKLTYARQGDLETYILARANRPPPQSLRAFWIRTLMKAFHHIYVRNVLHQDIKLNNIFVDQDSVKLGDFANGAIFPLGANMDAICAGDPLSRVDLLGIGCVIYSIAAWKVYNYGYFEKDCCWPRSDEVPETDGIMYREIIDKCWRNEYNNIPELYEDFQRLDNEQGASKGYEFPRLDFMMWFCMVPSALLFSGRYLSGIMAN